MNDGQLVAVVGLGAITLLAATVNGAIGYGFSSITVPLALILTTSRVLNPALVLVEVAINLHLLVVDRAAAPAALRRTSTLLVGLAPGVVLGSMFLASVSPELVKVATYVVLLPLILVQVSGLRRPLRSLRAVGAPFGAGIGLLYSVTTISGPPLALLLNNQGYAKREFRASLAVVRLAESSLTAVAYGILGLYTPASLALIPPIVPAVLVGIPLGAALIRRVSVEAFRRASMSFDALIVTFGLSRVLEQLGLTRGPAAYAGLAVVAAAVIVLLYRSSARTTAAVRRPAASTATGGD